MIIVERLPNKDMKSGLNGKIMIIHFQYSGYLLKEFNFEAAPKNH